MHLWRTKGCITAALIFANKTHLSLMLWSKEMRASCCSHLCCCEKEVWLQSCKGSGGVVTETGRVLCWKRNTKICGASLYPWSGVITGGILENQSMHLHLRSFPGLSGQTQLLSESRLGSGLAWCSNSVHALHIQSISTGLFKALCTDYCSYSKQLKWVNTLQFPIIWLMTFF